MLWRGLAHSHSLGPACCIRISRLINPRNVGSLVKDADLLYCFRLWVQVLSLAGGETLDHPSTPASPFPGGSCC